MYAFLYGLALQWKLDIRSKSLLITCYLVPLAFFAVMGGIFTSLDPQAKNTLIPSMIVMGTSMGAFIGLPPSIVEIFSSDIKKAYQANGVPIYSVVLTLFLSAFIHLCIMSLIIFIISPIVFDASLPTNLPLFFGSLAFFIMVSLSIGCVLGLAIKNQAKLTMLAQIIFLPSIMLSGIMFPITLLPKVFEIIGKCFPASWGYETMSNPSFNLSSFYPLMVILVLSITLCGLFIKRIKVQ